MFKSMFDQLKEVQYFKKVTDFKNVINVKYFKEIKCLKRLLKAEVCLVPKQASMTKLFCEYTQRLTTFAIKAPS